MRVCTMPEVYQLPAQALLLSLAKPAPFLTLIYLAAGTMFLQKKYKILPTTLGNVYIHL